jgi:hypothetical protein
VGAAYVDRHPGFEVPGFVRYWITPTG